MGSNHFKRDIPMLANLYLQGRLKLDELVAAQITLEQINDGYTRHAGGYRSPQRDRLLTVSHP